MSCDTGQYQKMSLKNKDLFNFLVAYARAIKKEMNAVPPSSKEYVESQKDLIDCYDYFVDKLLSDQEFGKLELPKDFIKVGNKENFVEKIIDSRAIDAPICLAVSAAVALVHFRFGGTLEFFEIKQDIDLFLLLGERIYEKCLDKEKLSKKNFLTFTNITNTINSYGRNLWPDFYERYDFIESIEMFDSLGINMDKFCGFICGSINLAHAVCVIKDSKTGQFNYFNSNVLIGNKNVSRFAFLNFETVREILYFGKVFPCALYFYKFDRT